MRVALGVSYNGSAYRGWQSQPGGATVQDRLEAALARFATHEVSTICAGRTDAGVHGLMQVVHFDTPLDRTPFSWVRGTNTFLPPDIAVQWARPVPEAFHSRASATARRYAYVLLQSPVRPSVESARVGWVFHALDGDAMRAAARHLIGEHDFTSFRASACQAKSPVKTLRRIEITQRGTGGVPAGQASGDRGDVPTCYWRFEFEGNAFLHHMVRNIMGCLVAVGQGQHPADWMHAVLQARSRDAAAPTFSPDGLYFLGPLYDPAWGLPDRTAAYDWLP
ncbi:tRNA pseudouridine(38-40) synthase TruA [Paracidovorax avenae]|uniref:tRNA pseudouridine(38-40) synthase TruA n=1 Tax=Paracidovorax avenae TaxID=80867 RepID=UPI000D15D698|nr:tRNA pseudouridine(38-40) synthase TruA [Paracidovorax avenae]AVS77274.1 tRNA pseudouridine(38-40) synthase TruA [Paracidovorax avenae]AVS84246.1 tRNA pseudouridine(38-40) synthase TruA [Paracidovorax avenae]AVS87714.1 tRNA pseudouridine(38-40) synthase TruA [Paracidovorax avenae]